MCFAAKTQAVLLWIIAEDRPLHKNAELLGDGDISQKKKQWLTYHDQKTGGIMGLQPMVKNMPLRITVTDSKRKDKSMFKNSRCILHGWTLHPVDEERLRNLIGMEMVLQHLPVRILVRMDGATWVEDATLGKGVAAVTPQRVTWALDRKWAFKVERFGFTVASDFSGTAHSFAGADLAAAIVNCKTWDAVAKQIFRNEKRR